MKPGWKTTEFWLSLGTLVLTNVQGSLPPAVQVAVSGVVTVGYAVARALAKRSTP